jgi:uncharacterized SAM-binding protein YcdF (DUF218 family)
MFFWASKVLDVALAPLSWSIVLSVIGLVLSWRRRGLGVALIALGLGVICVFGEDAIANKLWRALETPPLTTQREGVTYDAVIVLSGLVDDGATINWGVPSYNDSVERLLTAFTLLREGKAKNVIVSGGSGRIGGGLIEADVLAHQLEAWGIDTRRIFSDRESRNTHENALGSAKIVEREHWKTLLLVTSAFHMQRALGSFEQAGLQVDTLSVDFRSAGHAQDWFPRAGALSVSTAALREFIGRLIYKIAGYSR